MKSVLSLTCILTLSIACSLTAADLPDGAVAQQLIEQYERNFAQDGYPTATINAVTNNSIKALSLNRQKLLTHNKVFNHKLETAGITNQKSSGRCWLFAGLNILSRDVMAQLKLKEFELSQPYLTFWDKLEKANNFLEQIILLRDRPIDDRALQIVIESPIGDGGWWHYVTGLVEKYGLAPISAMPETKQSTSTGMINKLAAVKLRSFASELRRMHADGRSESDLRMRKEQMLSDIYTLLVYAYGPPPKEFTFRFESDDSTVTGDARDYTPASFYEEFFDDGLPEYVALVNNPTRGFDTLYRIELSRNMFESPDLTMLNLPTSRLKHYCRKALLDSQAVWFACDVGKQNYGDSGIFMTAIYDYSDALGLDFSLTKADRITYRDISPNHAMAFMGMDTADDGQPVKWLVENSWGEKKGDDGFWYMYDGWFDEYVLMTIIDRKLIEPEDLEKLKQKPAHLPAWDPFFQGLREYQPGDRR